MGANHYNRFGLDEEHIEFKHHFRRFVEKEITPIAQAADTEGRFPKEVYPLLTEHGYLGINFAEEIGGSGGDLITASIFYEELTRASAGVSAGVFAHQHLACGPLAHFGTDKQKVDFFDPAIRAEKIGCFGLTEPDAGSDIRGMKTTARRDGDDFIINGSKLYITNGTIADFILVAARTGEPRDRQGISMFIVETTDPGFSATLLDKVGNNSSSTAAISLDNIRVPASRMLGEEGRGLGQLKETLTDGRVLVASRGLGIGQEACDLIQQYAQTRQAFGQSIGKFEGVAFKVAEMATRADAARLMIYHAARLRMAGEDASKEASMAKFLASELAVNASSQSLLLHGAAGYMESMKIAQLFRDAPEASIGEGTNEVQLLVISKSLGLL